MDSLNCEHLKVGSSNALEELEKLESHPQHRAGNGIVLKARAQDPAGRASGTI